MAWLLKTGRGNQKLTLRYNVQGINIDITGGTGEAVYELVKNSTRSTGHPLYPAGQADDGA